MTLYKSVYYYYFFDPGSQFQGNKKVRCAIQKSTEIKLEWTFLLLLLHKNHAVRWHCTAESERRVAEIKS